MGLPPDQFPNLVELSGAMTDDQHPDERFELGLDILMRGIASYAEEAEKP
jgi:hypothetical protein